MAMREKIVEKILENRVTLIVGETGCGTDTFSLSLSLSLSLSD
jgi:HrpA-like RNA helicase